MDPVVHPVAIKVERVEEEIEEEEVVDPTVAAFEALLFMHQSQLVQAESRLERYREYCETINQDIEEYRRELTETENTYNRHLDYNNSYKNPQEPPEEIEPLPDDIEEVLFGEDIIRVQHL